MAYTTAQLVTAYTNANLGKAPDAATTLTLDAYATQSQTGGISDATALSSTLKLVNNTTAVAVETYQFFTGHAPSAAGLSYLVNSTTNTSDLNDAYYSKFSAENRFINFSINLATGSGEGAAAFAASYGTVSYAQTVASAYDKIIGNAAATAAGVDVAASVAFFSRAENIAYLTAFVKANTGLTAAADIDLAVKAALIGEILNAATVTGIGGYAKSTAALIADLSDGTLSTDNSAGINIITAYPNAPVGGNTIALTTGIDAVVGTTGNDTITALQNGTTTALLTALDSIDGGAGDDTFTLVDAITLANAAYTIPGTATIKNVETVNLTTTGNFAALNTKSWAGLTKVNLTSTGDGTGVGALTVADTTAASVTQAAGAVQVNGGTAITITNAGTGTSKAIGAAITSVSVTGGGIVTVDNSSDGGVTNGDNNSLTSVSLKSVNAAATIYGKGVTSVTVGGTTSADRSVTVNNGATGGHDLTVSASGTSDGTTSYTTTIVDNTANSVTVNATASAKVAVTSSTATTAGAAGSASLNLDLTGATAVTAFSGATATGNTTLVGLATGVVSVATGSGNDKFTLTATGAATVNSGAGNDTVTLGAALAAGSTVNLGAGNDKLLGTTVIAASTSTKVTVVDGGDGTDTLASALVNVGNAAQFKNFEILGLNSAGFDLSLLTGSTLTGLELFGTASGTYSGVTAAQGLTVSADSAGSVNVLGFTGTSGTADAYAVTFAAAGSSTTTPTSIDAGTLQVDTIEALTINSGSASGYAKNTITVTDANLRTVAVTGAQDTVLKFAGTVGATGTGNGVSLIDASAATGKTTVDTTGATTLNLASAGLTIKTGAGADTITLSNAKTFVVDAGAGNDVITTGSGAGSYTLTGGAGKDTFDVHLSLGATSTVTINDFVNSGDNIVFANKGNETFKAGAVDVSTATDFASALVLANAAAESFNTGTVGTDAAIVWFVYGTNTYILEDNTIGAVAATDLVVKLTGALDLSAGHATFAAGATPTLTLV